MPIKFLCPNGHQLTAPDNLAGKPGKCPKCNTPLVVPKPEEEEGEDEALPEGAAAPAEESPPAEPSSAETISQGSGKGTNKSDVFVFLCPNGHKLNGPSSLKGKAGQCPHCGAKFRIPADDDELELPEESPEETAASSSEQFVFPGFETQENIEEVYEAVEVEDIVDPPPEGVHPLSYIVGRLWDRKGDDTELEIFLAEGEIVAPELYSEILSLREFGVFGSQEGDGTYSVTIIPWDTVRKVGLRKLPELSDKVFR
jgi:hypothetical protein